MSIFEEPCPLRRPISSRQFIGIWADVMSPQIPTGYEQTGVAKTRCVCQARVRGRVRPWLALLRRFGVPPPQTSLQPPPSSPAMSLMSRACRAWRITMRAIVTRTIISICLVVLMVVVANISSYESAGSNAYGMGKLFSLPPSAPFSWTTIAGVDPAMADVIVNMAVIAGSLLVAAMTDKDQAHMCAPPRRVRAHAVRMTRRRRDIVYSSTGPVAVKSKRMNWNSPGDRTQKARGFRKMEYGASANGLRQLRRIPASGRYHSRPEIPRPRYPSTTAGSRVKTGTADMV